MDDKNVRTDPSLVERSNDGIAYASSGSTFPCADKNKSYRDAGSNVLAKVDVQTTRPCAVIGPDRIVPQPAADPYLKPGLVEPWQFSRPPEHHKVPDYQHQLTRNISPRQTFQENMPRIMVPPVRYNPAKVIEDQTYLSDKISPITKDIKLNISSETKYCDVPYTVTPLTNEHKSVRNTELPVSNVDPVFARSAPHAWSHSGVNVRSPRGYGPSELYQYPDYSTCPSLAGAAPRIPPMNRMHRSGQEEVVPIHPDTYYRGGNIRFEPYPSAKDRYQPPRYDYITNYANPYNPPNFPSHKYDIQKLPPSALPSHPYPGYPQVPLKYLEKMRDPLREGYQRSPNQSNFGVQFHNQGTHPNYGSVPGNCLQNKLYTYPTDSSAHADPHTKPPYETNKAYMQPKHYAAPNNYYLNELAGSHHMKPQMVMPNYPSMNMHPVPPYPYYRKENMPYKNYDFPMQYKNADPLYNTQLQRRQSQFSPNLISPVESNTSNDHAFSVSPDDCGYASQSSSTSIRSTDTVMNRYRVYDPRYGHMIRGSPLASRIDSESKTISSKDKKNIDLRQFLQSWNEGDDEHGDGNTNKETVHPNSSDVKRYEVLNNQEQLYVLGLVNVPSEELDKYEHIQKVSKLPDNIKGYTSIDLLNQFEEAIESTKISNNYISRTAEEVQPPVKANLHLPSNRPLSPLDVEAKISQSVIHKEVGCNFELRLCSPKMMNVEVASPAQNVLGERVIEKMTNPLIVKSPSVMPNIEENCSIVKRQNRRRSLNREEAPNIPSCKMIKTQYSVETSIENKKSDYSIQDLESNSGVCLASLPRLDNEIELSFPEVNQQFINANKVEPTISVPHSNLPSLDINDNGSLSSKHMNQKKDNPFSPSQEFSKLSKYRKSKTNKESTDSQVQKPAQPVRTDSVIIKNPENSENISMVEDEVKQDQSDQHLTPTSKPMNLSTHSPFSGSTDLNDVIEIKSLDLATLNIEQTLDTKTSSDTHITKQSIRTVDIATDLTSSKDDITKDYVETSVETSSSLEINNKLLNKSHDFDISVNDYKVEDDDEVLSLEQERRRQSLSLEAQLTPMTEDTSDESDSDSDTGTYKDDALDTTASIPHETATTQSTSGNMLLESKKPYEMCDSQGRSSFHDQMKHTAFNDQLATTTTTTTTGSTESQSACEDTLLNVAIANCYSEKTAVQKVDDCMSLGTNAIKSPDNANIICQKLSYQKEHIECDHTLNVSASKNSAESISKIFTLGSENVHKICQQSEFRHSKLTLNVSERVELKNADESISVLPESKINISSETFSTIPQPPSKFTESEEILNVFPEKPVEVNKFDDLIPAHSESDIKDKSQNPNEICQQSSETSEPKIASNVSTSVQCPINENTEYHSRDHQSEDSDSDSSSDSETSSCGSTSEAEQCLNSDSEVIDRDGRTPSKNYNKVTVRDGSDTSTANLSYDLKCSISDRLLIPTVNEEKECGTSNIVESLNSYSAAHNNNTNITESGTDSSDNLCFIETETAPSGDMSSDKTTEVDDIREKAIQFPVSTESKMSLAFQRDNNTYSTSIAAYTDNSTESVGKQSYDPKHETIRIKSLFFYKELFSAVFQHLILEEGLCASIPAFKTKRKHHIVKMESTIQPKKKFQKSPTDLVEERLERMHASDTSLQGSSDENEKYCSKMDSHGPDSADDGKLESYGTKDSISRRSKMNEKIRRIESSDCKDLISSLSEESYEVTSTHHSREKLKESEHKYAVVSGSSKPKETSTLIIPDDSSKDVVEDQSRSDILNNIANPTQCENTDFFDASGSCNSEDKTTDYDFSVKPEPNIHSESLVYTDNRKIKQSDGYVLEKNSSNKSEDNGQLSFHTTTFQQYPYDYSQHIKELPLYSDNALLREMRSEKNCTILTIADNFEEKLRENCQSNTGHTVNDPNFKDEDVLNEPLTYKAEIQKCEAVDQSNFDSDNATQCEVETRCSREPVNISNNTPIALTDNVEEGPPAHTDIDEHIKDDDDFKRFVTYEAEDDNGEPVVELNVDNKDRTLPAVKPKCSRETENMSTLLTDKLEEAPRELRHSKPDDRKKGSYFEAKEVLKTSPINKPKNYNVGELIINSEKGTQFEVEARRFHESENDSISLSYCQSKPDETDKGANYEDENVLKKLPTYEAENYTCLPAVELNASSENATQYQVETSCSRESEKINTSLTDNFEEAPRACCLSKPDDTVKGANFETQHVLEKSPTLKAELYTSQSVTELIVNSENAIQCEVETSCSRKYENIGTALRLADEFEAAPRQHCLSKSVETDKALDFEADNDTSQPIIELYVNNDNATQCEVETSCSHEPVNSTYYTPIALTDDVEEGPPADTDVDKHIKDEDIFKRFVTYEAEDDNGQPVVELIVDNKDRTLPAVEPSSSHEPEDFTTTLSVIANVEEQSKPDDTLNITHVKDGDVLEKSVPYGTEIVTNHTFPTNLSYDESSHLCQTESHSRNHRCTKCCDSKDRRRKLTNFQLNSSRRYRRKAKRSLSESAIYSDNHNLDKENMKSEELWSKRKKIAEANEDMNSPFLTSENISNLIQSRRNSVSSFYHDENVSFCILIDNDCIITQEDFDQEAICFADIPEENFSTVVDNHILASNEIEMEPKTTTLDQSIVGEVIVPMEEKTVEESWVEDVACVETVVSEDVEEDCNDIYEDVTETSPIYDDRTCDSDKSDLDMFSKNDHADKIKHIYGNEMCSSQSIKLIKTLYTTPQMDVNKALHHTESLDLESTNKIDFMETVHSTPITLNDKTVCDSKTDDADNGSSPDVIDSVKLVNDNNCLLINDVCTSKTINFTKKENVFEFVARSPDILSKNEDEVAQLSESSNDEVFYAKEAADHPHYKGFSSSPEVSSTTEEKKSGILLKITNYNGSRISHINDIDVDSNRRIRCKFTEENDYRSNLASSRPLITKAAQKYIPPLKETTINDLKVKLFLPEHSLLKLKQIKLSKAQPKMDLQKQIIAKNNFKMNKVMTNKKPKPKFEDVLKSIDEIQFKMHKEKSKKVDKTIPKVIIKKNGNGSHYASSSAREVFNPDMTGRKWQPWVFLEKNKFIDKMALRGKTRAVYCHRKNNYILADNFKKYRSIGSTKFFISQPKPNSNPEAPLKYTIKLKQVCET